MAGVGTNSAFFHPHWCSGHPTSPMLCVLHQHRQGSEHQQGLEKQNGITNSNLGNGIS